MALAATTPVDVTAHDGKLGWFTREELVPLYNRVATACHDATIEYAAYESCLGAVDAWLRGFGGMHTAYHDGYVQNAIWHSLNANLRSVARVHLHNQLLRAGVLKVQVKSRVQKVEHRNLGAQFPNIFRCFACTDAMTTAQRKQVFRRISKLLPVLEAYVEGSLELDAICDRVVSANEAVLGGWHVAGCRVGAGRIPAEYASLLEDDKHSFRLVSEGDGDTAAGDKAVALVARPSGRLLVRHQVYEGRSRHQCNFQVDLPVVILLHKGRRRRAVTFAFSILDFTVSLREPGDASYARRVRTYRLPSGVTVQSLTALGWCAKKAALGDPLSASYYVFHRMLGDPSEGTLHALDRLAQGLARSSGPLPPELAFLAPAVAALGDTPTQTKMGKKVRLPRAAAFVHDFARVLRVATDCAIASHAIGLYPGVDHIDRLQIE